MVVACVLGFVVGAVLGSYGCVVASRGGVAASAQGRSACVCGRALRWWENIPVVSWLVLRGRAACCAAPIPASVWLWEVGGGALGAALAVGASALLG